MLLRRLIPGLFLLPVVCPAVSKEMAELMRDVNLLQQQLTDLQQSQDEKLTRLTVLVQQTFDAASKANTAVAVLENNIRGSIQSQEKNVVAPVVGVGTKVDNMSSDVQALRGSMEEISSRLGKLQLQLTDLTKAVQAMQAPAPPPPAQSAQPGGAGGPSGPPANLPPASLLYDNARRDRMGGKLDLALQQFQDYLRYYTNTDLAPNAQFYIGDIHFAQGDFESALKDFDAVLEHYSDNSKTPDALFMKGKTLVRMGRPTQGAQEFRERIKRYPNHDLALQARAQLKSLGLSPGAAAAPKPSAGSKRKRQ
jgi:TolA-binding protein